MEPIYSTEIKEIGPEVEAFLEEKYLILFEVGAPPELAEMSVLHDCSHMREEPPAPGDVLAIGEKEFRVTAVGEKAWKNVAELGHAVFVFNGAREAEMPGQICLEEGSTQGLAEAVKPGVRLEMRAGAGIGAARGGEDAARES
ncbi:PTS cellobiose transporter subunit IIB [Rubrobacter marinus]|uniref:PTS cellobiose transporter subunit IIB n=1 Tax=Rubrobacter marinus TaxID=2653852 RepID=A0A6G8PWJ1_9ACTN|nr:PTS glucitol/sorbitol transporter subunit IIA [Rubrobacter marinus]QIN78545.1 PTS cellobiose transporter subunit IIB [Rubrobacter marinus]